MDNYSILSRAIGEAFEPKLDEFINSVNFDVNAELSKKFERKMDKLIRRRNKPYFNLICTGGRRAACIAAVIIILSASSLSVEAVREVVHVNQDRNILFKVPTMISVFHGITANIFLKSQAI